MIITAIILFIAVLCYDLISDYSKWLHERSVDHDKEGWIRGALLAPTIILLAINEGPMYLLLTVPLTSAWYWLLFDGLYNVFRGFNWWFTGSDDPDDARTDNFLQKLTLTQHKLIKFGSVILFTFLYLIL